MQWWTRFFLCSAASEAVAIQEHTIAGGASSITYDASGVSEAMGRAVAADHSTELLSSTTGLMLVPARKLDASSPLHATQRAVHAGLSVTGISANSTEWFGSKHGSEVMEILGSASGNALTPAASITAGLQLTAPSQLVKDVQELRYLGQGAQGVVYEGVWQGATVAVKFTISEKMDQQAYELLFSKMLSHPNVVQTFLAKVAILDDATLHPPPDNASDSSHDDATKSSEASGSSSSTELRCQQQGHASPKHGSAKQMVLSRRASERSDDGFGDPYGRKAIFGDVRGVLHAIGARPGQYITQMVMELCDHGSLHGAIQRGMFKPSSRWGAQLAMRALVRTAREIAQGMLHLHSQQVLHGDLKPANVLLISSRKDRRGYAAKVSDFGLAQLCPTQTDHISNAPWGTLMYMAPERLLYGQLFPASDTYSFGVILWEMYHGARPHENMHAVQMVIAAARGDALLDWAPGAPDELVQLANACMAADHTNRPTFQVLMVKLTQMEARVRSEGMKHSIESRINSRLSLESNAGAAPSCSTDSRASNSAFSLAPALMHANTSVFTGDTTSQSGALAGGTGTVHSGALATQLSAGGTNRRSADFQRSSDLPVRQSVDARRDRNASSALQGDSLRRTPFAQHCLLSFRHYCQMVSPSPSQLGAMCSTSSMLHRQATSSLHRQLSTNFGQQAAHQVKLRGSVDYSMAATQDVAAKQLELPKQIRWQISELGGPGVSRGTGSSRAGMANAMVPHTEHYSSNSRSSQPAGIETPQAHAAQRAPLVPSGCGGGALMFPIRPTTAGSLCLSVAPSAAPSLSMEQTELWVASAPRATGGCSPTGVNTATGLGRLPGAPIKADSPQAPLENMVSARDLMLSPGHLHLHGARKAVNDVFNSQKEQGRQQSVNGYSDLATAPSSSTAAGYSSLGMCPASPRARDEKADTASTSGSHHPFAAVSACAFISCGESPAAFSAMLPAGLSSHASVPLRDAQAHMYPGNAANESGANGCHGSAPTQPACPSTPGTPPRPTMEPGCASLSSSKSSDNDTYLKRAGTSSGSRLSLLGAGPVAPTSFSGMRAAATKSSSPTSSCLLGQAHGSLQLAADASHTSTGGRKSLAQSCAGHLSRAAVQAQAQLLLGSGSETISSLGIARPSTHQLEPAADLVQLRTLTGDDASRGSIGNSAAGLQCRQSSSNNSSPLPPLHSSLPAELAAVLATPYRSPPSPFTMALCNMITNSAAEAGGMCLRLGSQQLGSANGSGTPIASMSGYVATAPEAGPPTGPSTGGAGAGPSCIVPPFSSPLHASGGVQEAASIGLSPAGSMPGPFAQPHESRSPLAAASRLSPRGPLPPVGQSSSMARGSSPSAAAAAALTSLLAALQSTDKPPIPAAKGPAPAAHAQVPESEAGLPDFDLGGYGPCLCDNEDEYVDELYNESNPLSAFPGGFGRPCHRNGGFGQIPGRARYSYLRMVSRISEEHESMGDRSGSVGVPSHSRNSGLVQQINNASGVTGSHGSAMLGNAGGAGVGGGMGSAFIGSFGSTMLGSTGGSSSSPRVQAPQSSSRR